jgi:formyltetrahydrofolate deformylase
MQIVITAVGPDNVRLADPIIHYVTGEGASIAEIQMYDHDESMCHAAGSTCPTPELRRGRSRPSVEEPVDSSLVTGRT